MPLMITLFGLVQHSRGQLDRRISFVQDDIMFSMGSVTTELNMTARLGISPKPCSMGRKGIVHEMLVEAQRHCRRPLECGPYLEHNQVRIFLFLSFTGFCARPRASGVFDSLIGAA